MLRNIKLSLLASLVLFFAFVNDAFAAQLQSSTIRFDRMQIGAPSNVLIKIIPTSVGSEAKLRVSFGVGTTVGSSITTSITNLGSGVVALPGTLTAAKSGQDVIISGLTDLSVGTTYGVNISVGISTPGTTGEVQNSLATLTSGDVVIDSSNIATRFITSDQLVITANVPPIFSFTISANTDAFTTDLTPGAVSSTTGRTVSVSTNASKGWTGWVKSANAGLNSSVSGDSIATLGTVDGSTSTCSAGSDCYLLDAQKTTTGSGSGALNIDTEYAGNNSTTGGSLSTLFQPFVSRTGKTAGDVITVVAHASVVATKSSASDYSDTLTIIGAGNF